MTIPQLSKREVTILLACLGLVVASLVYNYILEPFATRWTTLNSEIRMMQLKLKKSTAMLRRRMEIGEQYEHVASFISTPRGSDEEEITHLLSALERLASTSNARITDIKPRPPKQEDFYKKYIVEVESEGEITTFTKFIYEIQNSPELLNVEKVSLTMKGGTGTLLKAYMLVTKIIP